MIFEHQTYRSFLKSSLEERVRKNPSYSMRKLALQLGMTSAYLTEILKGRKNPSASMALQMAMKLGLKGAEAEYFCTLVALETTQNPLLKEQVITRLNSLGPRRTPVQDLSVDLFRAISDWYHLAIRNIVELDGFVATPSAIAERLGISRIEADLGLQRLLKLEMIEAIPGAPHRYRRTEPISLAQSTTPNGALRAYHKQTLEKAIESLETQTPQEKIVASQTFSFNTADLPNADRLIDEFLEKFRRLSTRPGPKNEVYHLGLQLFSLSKRRKRR